MKMVNREDTGVNMTNHSHHANKPHDEVIKPHFNLNSSKSWEIEHLPGVTAKHLILLLRRGICGEENLNFGFAFLFGEVTAAGERTISQADTHTIAVFFGGYRTTLILARSMVVYRLPFLIFETPNIPPAALFPRSATTTGVVSSYTFSRSDLIIQGRVKVKENVR
jgi:hypothetical protein